MMPGMRDRRPTLTALLILLTAPQSIAGELSNEVQTALESITGRRAMAHIKLLSSRHLEGRATGEDGFDLASTYARTQYQAAGLKGGADSGAFNQSFRLRYDRLGERMSLAVEARRGDGSATTHFALGEQFIPFRFSTQASIRAGIVFAGYGISAPELDWDDYAGVDVRGKVVLVLRHEPQEADGDSKFDGKRMTRHASFLTKVRTAQDKGAVALLLVTDPLHHDDQRPSNSLARWPELDPERYEREGRAIPRGRPVLSDRYDDIAIPALHVGPRVVDRILAGTDRTLEELQRRLDERLRPDSFVVAGRMVELETSFTHEYVAAHNVIARLEGRDPDLAGEYVVVGGHLDHVGKNWRGEIHPGADDNASGTAAVLEIARAMATLAEPPRRSVLFVNFAAEELGLLGAYHLVGDPPIDLDKVVGLLNLDMIGRNSPNAVNVVGKRRAPQIHSLILESNETIGMRLKYEAGAGAGRSDNFPFWTKGVPAVSFFTGTHEDYHRPGDTWSKVVPNKVESIARLAFLTAYRMAETAEMTPTVARSVPQQGGPGGGEPRGGRR